MPDPLGSMTPPPRRADLIFGPPGDDGAVVVKDPASGTFFKLGPEEAFLLAQMDGRHTIGEIGTAFAQRFGQPLSGADVLGFVELAQAQGFLQPQGRPAVPVPPPASAPAPAPTPAPTPGPPTPAAPPQADGGAAQNLLYWRKSFFDPDRFFNWLEPKIRFVWTRGFLALSLLFISAAGVVLWLNARELVTDLPGALRWETLAVAWVALFLLTLGHEFAHGLTCKHYGGEVHEVGFLLLFFMPCFYCNVSDAWLFPQKSKRLWVSLAGGYWDLCAWAVAVFVWRLTQPQTPLHYLAYVALSICGTRIFLNLNPLLKLDGYYLLSDWAEIPNLRQRSWDLLSARTRWLLWGGPRPSPDPRATFLLLYGVASWVMSLTYLGLMLLALIHTAGLRYGLLGILPVALFATFLLRGMLQGFTAGEVRRMIRTRYLRTAGWLLALGTIPAGLAVVSLEDRAGGSFQVRPLVRGEVRAPVAGFVQAVHFDEGDRVSSSSLVAQLEVPDLDSRAAQKRSEVREAEAKLRLLEAGPRQEELDQGRCKLERCEEVLALARRNLTRSREALKEELAWLDSQLSQDEADLDNARSGVERDQRLYTPQALATGQLRERRRSYEAMQSRLAQTKAQRRAREAQGTQEAELEVARRETDAAQARAALTLLEAGTRQEKVEAEGARLARLREELRYLESLSGRLQARSPVAGLVTTPRLKERVGQYLKEGDLICSVDDPSVLEVEIFLDEQEAARVQEGARVELKARALPFRTFEATLIRLAPVAQKPEAPGEPARPAPAHRADGPSTVTAYCRVEAAEGLRPGMTGYARVYCGQRRAGEVLLERALRLVRTEYWW